jgi:ornithine carbamoyltransferase
MVYWCVQEAVLSTKDFLSVADVSPEGLRGLIESAISMKAARWSQALRQKLLVLVFEKPSNRTRVSFDAGMNELGGHCIYLSPDEVRMGTRETAKDVALVLSRYAHGIAARTFEHRTVEELAEHAAIPVINALSGLEHPCQALADLMTITEHKGDLTGLTVAYVGDGNNCANSLMLACAMSGADFRIASPAGYRVSDDMLAKANTYAAASGATVTCLKDPAKAVRGADAVYTDVWTSMGQETEAQERRKAFKGYQVTAKLMEQANKDAVLLHPLPAHHGEEVEEGLIYGRQSVVFDQAENRLHAQKALLVKLLA